MSSTLYNPLFDEDQISASNVFVSRRNYGVFFFFFFFFLFFIFLLFENTQVKGINRRFLD